MIFGPTSPTNQNQLIVKILNFCDFCLIRPIRPTNQKRPIQFLISAFFIRFRANTGPKITLNEFEMARAFFLCINQYPAHSVADFSRDEATL